MTMVEVTQEDREAAANLYLDLEGPPYSPKDLSESDAHRRGEYDAHPAVQAFARHRTQSIAADKARIAELEVQVEKLYYDGIHTCSGQCQRPACVLRRENTSLRAQLANTLRWLRYAMDGGYDAALPAAVAELEAALSTIKGDDHVG